MLSRVRHSKSLPVRITSHQMLQVSRRIHELVTDVATPLVEANPQYQAVVLTLGQLETAMNELSEAQNRRKYKSSVQMRGVGGRDGLTDETRLSQQKRDIYERRRGLMRRIRQMVAWKKEDALFKDLSDLAEAASRIGRLIDRRIDKFEDLIYEESTSEFEHFIEAMDGDSEVAAALSLLELAEVYADMKQMNETFIDIHQLQTQVDAELEEKPKLPAAMQDVRRVVSVLLTLMHFDIESGSPVFKKVLGHCDEHIDKIRSVSKLRKTLSQKPAKGTSGASTAPDTPDTSDSGATDTAETSEGQADATSEDDAASDVDQAQQTEQTPEAMTQDEPANATTG